MYITAREIKTDAVLSVVCVDYFNHRCIYEFAY